MDDRLQAAERVKDRWTALSLSLLSALAAAISIPASLWELDEQLFAQALHNLDAADHLPHPPGFPVYIGTARLIHLFVHADTLALGLAGVFFAALLGAGLFFSFRWIFRDRTVAVAASLLTILSPAVLVFAGMPRSDAPGLAVGLVALAFSLHGTKSPRALMAAGVALGLAFGVRVTVLPAVAPVFLAAMIIQFRRGKRKAVVAAALLALVVALLCYAIIALDAGLPRYIRALKVHARFIYTTDTIGAHNVNRVLSYRLSRFFADPWGGKDKAQIVLGLALLGLALAVFKDRRALGWLLLSFIPIMIFSVAYVTPLAGPLYSLPYLPFFTGLAAFFLVQGARILARTFKQPRLSALGGMAVMFLAIMSVGWTWPIMAMRRAEASPPAQALRYIREHLDQEHVQILYDKVFMHHILYAIPDWRTRPWDGDPASLNDLNLLDPDFSQRPIYSLTPKPYMGKAGIHFAWSSHRTVRRLERLGLGRYSDAYLLDVRDIRNVLWLDGWLGQESDGRLSWRQMGRRAHVALFTPADTMTLRFRCMALGPKMPENDSTVILSLDDREIDRFVNHGREEERVLAVRTGLEEIWHNLTVETCRSGIPRGAGREESQGEPGLKCFGLEWTAAPGAVYQTVERGRYLKEGWYEPEQSWIWTGERAVLTLPAMRSDGRLQLVMRTPWDASGKRGRMTIAVGSRTIDTFDPPEGVFTRTIVVPASWRQGKPTDLVLSIDKTVQKPRRRLGICVFYAGWVPCPPRRLP